MRENSVAGAGLGCRPVPTRREGSGMLVLEPTPRFVSLCSLNLFGYVFASFAFRFLAAGTPAPDVVGFVGHRLGAGYSHPRPGILGDKRLCFLGHFSVVVSGIRILGEEYEGLLVYGF